MGKALISKTSLNMSFALLVALAGFLAYANTFNGNWVWDDASSVLLHKHVQDPAQLVQLFKEDQHAFGAGDGNFYRPLLSVTFMLDFLLSYDPQLDANPSVSYPAIKPFYFHLSSLVWHIAAALALMALLFRIGAPPFVCGTVPLLYVLHPLHTEAVAYISGRADMMSATFMYLALFLALSPAQPPKKFIAWGFSALCLIAGLCSKESTMIFPLILGLFVFLRPGLQDSPEKSEGYSIGRFIPLAVSAFILGGYIFLRSTVLHFADTASPEASSFAQRLTESAQAFTLYIQSLFFPTHMHMERTLEGIPNWYALVGSLLMACIVAGAFIFYKAGQRRIAVGLAWFLLAWLPISGLFPLNAPLAEHWMYVPMAGFWWAFAELLFLGAQRIPTLRYTPYATTYTLAVIFLALTVARNQDWDSDKTLFQATLKENPETQRVHFNLAVTFEDILDNPAGARRHFLEVLRIMQENKRKAGQDTRFATPEELEVHLSLGKVNEALGEYNKAAQHYAVVTAVKDNPMLSQMATLANYRLGHCLLALGDLTNANRYFQEALAKEPSLIINVERLLMGAPISDS